MQGTTETLRWLKMMGHYNRSLSLDASIMALKHSPIIGEHVVYHFCITIGWHSNRVTC